MGFYIGTAIKEYNGKYVVAATCWFAGIPLFSTRGMTLPYMKEKLLSVVIVQAKGDVKAINAAAQRTLERLFIKRIVQLPKPPNKNITLLIPPSMKKHEFIFKHKSDAKHWLVRGAKRALAEWIGAQNVRNQRRRKRPSKAAR